MNDFVGNPKKILAHGAINIILGFEAIHVLPEWAMWATPNIDPANLLGIS